MIRKIAAGAIVATLVLASLLADNCFAQSGISNDMHRLNQALFSQLPGGQKLKRSYHYERPGVEHGIVIKDVFVSPAAHEGPAYPCCENYPCCDRTCGKVTGECVRCAEGKCGGCSEDKCDGCSEGKCQVTTQQECQRCKQGSCPRSCEGKKTEQAVAREPANETARAVLEIMDALGHSVIAGTEFEPSEDTVPEELPTPLAEPANIRAALIKYIHALEAQHAAEEAECAATVNISDEIPIPHETNSEPESPADDVVHALRESSVALDEAASQLEALEFYERADQVRAMAQELRHDARRMKTGGRVVHVRRHAFPVVEPTCDEDCPGENPACVEHRLRMLREAMRREVIE